MGLTPHAIWGVTNTKIKFGILLCCFLVRFSFKYFRWCFCYFLWCAPKRRCCFIISVFDYSKPRCYYSCLYAVMRNFDAIIRVCMLLCETSMLLFVSVCCYAKPRCYYSCPYAVMRNLDAIIRVSNYVRLNPGLQRARPLWSSASDKLIMPILPA